jgi:hypothetical protein
MLYESEDSEKLNTAFIERLNLTIRQGSSYPNGGAPSLFAFFQVKNVTDDKIQSTVTVRYNNEPVVNNNGFWPRNK